MRLVLLKKTKKHLDLGSAWLITFLLHEYIVYKAWLCSTIKLQKERRFSLSLLLIMLSVTHTVSKCSAVLMCRRHALPWGLQGQLMDPPTKLPREGGLVRGCKACLFRHSDAFTAQLSSISRTTLWVQHMEIQDEIYCQKQTVWAPCTWLMVMSLLKLDGLHLLGSSSSLL